MQFSALQFTTGSLYQLLIASKRCFRKLRRPLDQICYPVTRYNPILHCILLHITMFFVFFFTKKYQRFHINTPFQWKSISENFVDHRPNLLSCNKIQPFPSLYTTLYYYVFPLFWTKNQIKVPHTHIVYQHLRLFWKCCRTVTKDFIASPSFNDRYKRVCVRFTCNSTFLGKLPLDWQVHFALSDYKLRRYAIIFKH